MLQKGYNLSRRRIIFLIRFVAATAIRRGRRHQVTSYIHQQGQAGHPLHRENEERDHGKVPAVFMGLDSGQNFLEGRVGGSEGKQRDKTSEYFLFKLRGKSKCIIKH